MNMNELCTEGRRVLNNESILVIKQTQPTSNLPPLRISLMFKLFFCSGQIQSVDKFESLEHYGVEC